MFYKYKSFSDEQGNDTFKWAFDSLINKYFYFFRPEQLNDPLDCKVINEYDADDVVQNWINRSPTRYFKTVDYIRNQLELGIFQKNMEISARKDEQHFHVLSLTDNWQNHHMWEKYASAFEGIYIGYNSFFMDEEGYHYIEANSIIDGVPFVEASFRNVGSKGYFVLQKVPYDNDGKHKYNVFKSEDKNNKDNIAYALLHKTEKWKEENEYRKILRDTLNSYQPDNFAPKDLLVFYPENVLVEINFGYKCNPEIRKNLIDCIKRHYSNWQEIRMYSVKLSESDGSLFREKIENV